MDIKTLESFKLSDAVKFHDELNPRLWRGNRLDPAVRKQLLIIAEDFVEELGIGPLDIEDITVSGSNAAYSYTPHSDLDLHILVDMNKLPADEVYRELFQAKKNLYNDSHNISIHGVPVELYVQDTNQPVVSLGEYSLLQNKWLKLPTKRRANLDQNATRAKYERLKELVELALKTKSLDRVNEVLALIKRYRKAGLDLGGEFSPENLAFKVIRKQGWIQKLYDLRSKLHSEELTIETMYKAKPKYNLAEKFAKEFEDYHPNAKPKGPEFKPTMPSGTIKVDVSDVYDWYKLGQHISDMDGLGKHDFGKGPPSTILSFGDEDLEHKYIDALNKTGLDTTDIDPKGHEPKKGQKVDPTYNVGEQGVAEGSLNEYRDALYNFVRSKFPTWPEYVLKDFLYAQAKGIRDKEELKDFLERNQKDFGQVKWRLEKLPITLDIFTPKTQQMIQSREGGSSNPFQVPKDAERHAQQLKMIQQQGVRTEPIIVAKLSNGYDLIEGWHRTIQHLKAYPEGYIGPAWVGYGATYKSESKQGVAEGKIKLSTDPNWYGAEVGDYKASGPIVNIPANRLVGFEPDDKMNQPASKANVEKIVAGLKQGAKLPPLLVRQYKNGYQVLDGHHRFWAYKLLGVKSIPAQVVPAEDIEEITKQGVAEARTNPEQNPKPESGFKELASIANTINDPENWAISMTSEPKLGINPQVGISEDTPKGIYFYPLNYALDKTRYGKLPWGDNYPYIQLFQYDRSNEMTKQTKVDPAKLKKALLQYCPEEVIQQAIDDPEYDGTPYWFIYDCLSRLGKNDETNVVRWNKVLRDLGFTSVYDDGDGWIAYNEPTQGVVLDPRVIKQHKTITNKKQSKLVTPAVIEQAIFETMDMELASNRAWQAYDPDGSKLRQAAKEYAKKPEFKQYYGKPGSEEIFDKAAGWGRYGARQLSEEAYEWYKAQKAQQKVDEASGYIPSEKEKNDPRFKSALTVDVKPNSIKKNAKAFSWLTSRAGIPPDARPDGKIK